MGSAGWKSEQQMMLVDAAKDDIKRIICWEEEYLKFIENNGASSGKVY